MKSEFKNEALGQTLLWAFDMPSTTAEDSPKR